MKLSEAIRLGAMLKPQGSGRFYQNGRTCALGAALDAIGRLDTSREWSEYDLAEKSFPALCAVATPPDWDGYSDPPLWRAIEWLNDCEHWTREQIADWVATIEAQHEAKQAEQPVAVEVAK